MAKRWVMWITVVGVFGLIAAGCADSVEDEGADVETDDATDDTDAADDDTTDDDADPADDDTADDGDSDDATDDDAELVLTDSAPGVTAETITIGHTSIDFDTLNNDFGLNLANRNYGPQMDAIVALYNERGGVLGRQIEVIHELFLPVGPTSADAACLKLTEDVEVFAILNGFAGPGAENVNECITDLHDTILVGGIPTTEQTQRAGGLWISDQMSPDRRVAAGVTLMDEAGVLGDLGPIMIVGANADEEALVEVMGDTLTDAGAEVTTRTFITTTGDEPATQSEVDILIARAESDGVETVALIGSDVFRNTHFFRNAPDLTYIVDNGDRISGWGTEAPTGLEPGTRVLTNNEGTDAFDDPRVQECVQVVNEAQGIEVQPVWLLGLDEPNYWAGTVGSCRRMALFVQIAETAGADLTNDTWVGALDNVTDLSVPGYDFASLSSDKTDVRDQLALVEYDLDTLSFEPLTDPVDMG